MLAGSLPFFQEHVQGRKRFSGSLFWLSDPVFYTLSWSIPKAFPGTAQLATQFQQTKILTVPSTGEQSKFLLGRLFKSLFHGRLITELVVMKDFVF